MIELDALTLTLLVGTVMPLATALVTKLQAAPRVKAVVNLVLSVASGMLTFLATTSGPQPWQLVVGAGAAAYFASGVMYQNLWRPTGAAEVVAASSAGFGVGSTRVRRRRR